MEDVSRFHEIFASRLAALAQPPPLVQPTPTANRTGVATAKRARIEASGRATPVVSGAARTRLEQELLAPTDVAAILTVFAAWTTSLGESSKLKHYLMLKKSKNNVEGLPKQAPGEASTMPTRSFDIAGDLMDRVLSSLGRASTRKPEIVLDWKENFCIRIGSLAAAAGIVSRQAAAGDDSISAEVISFFESLITHMTNLSDHSREAFVTFSRFRDAVGHVQQQQNHHLLTVKRGGERSALGLVAQDLFVTLAEKSLSAASQSLATLDQAAIPFPAALETMSEIVDHMKRRQQQQHQEGVVCLRQRQRHLLGTLSFLGSASPFTATTETGDTPLNDRDNDEDDNESAGGGASTEKLDLLAPGGSGVLTLFHALEYPASPCPRSDHNIEQNDLLGAPHLVREAFVRRVEVNWSSAAVSSRLQHRLVRPSK